MEDILLLDAIERYLSGQMLPEEKAWFQKLRENTPGIDQMVVEHRLFLQQINDFADNTALKHTIAQAHENLTIKGEIYSDGKTSAKGKVIQLFHRYKKVTAIAASIAGVTALTISVLVAALSPSANKSDIERLGREINVVKREVSKDNATHANLPVKPSVEHNYIVGGTAFLIDAKGYLVTNAHVLQGTGAVVVNKGQEFDAKIVAVDKARDLAILKIDDDDYKPMPGLPYSIKKSNVQLGEELFTLGYPNDQISYSLGYLSAEMGYKDDTTSCQISLSANPGNSGSPVFNKNGDVVGILTSKNPQADGAVFAVKSKEIYQMIEDLKAGDTTVQKIKVSNNSSLKGQSRTEQVNKARDFVFIVKAYN